MRNHCLIGTVFQCRKIEMVSDWVVVMVAQQCECTQGLKMVNFMLWIGYHTYKKSPKVHFISHLNLNI